MAETRASTKCKSVDGTRRRFLLEAPILVAAVAACGTSEVVRRSTADTATATPPVEHRPIPNPDSRADTSLHHAMPSSSAAPGAASAAAAVAFHRFDPALPPLSAERVRRLHFTVKEVPIRVRDDLVVAAWTFDGDMPGPIVHVRQGDTVEFTLTNAGQIPHSMDFHAARIDPKTAFRSVIPGQSETYSFKPKYAGAFLYHCGTAPVLM
ncbi:MAG: multicopper oxidase domain-containing protein, partial [Gemmatimonadaceae bacterium]